MQLPFLREIFKD
jgi:MEMO1 family protein